MADADAAETGNPLDATAEEMQHISDLREAIAVHPQTKEDSGFLTDTTLLRYLRARDGNVKKAANMLEGSLEWRAEWKPEQISAEEVLEDIEMGKMYVQGSDRQGRPVVIFRPARDKDGVGSILTKVRFYVWTLEQAIQRMPPGEHQMVWLVDMNGYRVGPSDLKRISLAKALLETLQNQYPERVARVIMVQPPWYFRVLFAMVRPLLSQRTLDKVIYDMRNADGRYEKLEEAVAPEQLDPDYGGSLPTPAFTIEGATTGAAENTADDDASPEISQLSGKLAALDSKPERLTAV